MEGSPFNRGKLINVGSKIVYSRMQEKCNDAKTDEFLCIIAHDVDMLPNVTSMEYNCKNRYTITQKFAY